MSNFRDMQKSLAEWTEILCVQDMPIFSNTAQSIYQTLGDEFKGATELSKVIMRDPVLMSKLLKISDSPFYNRSGQSMTTVIRAIMLLGAAAIRELAIACSFFEAVLSSENQAYANQLIGDAIHSAVQAKELSVYFKLKAPESVFIATLLNTIGEIALGCFASEQLNQINELVETSKLPREEVEMQVLGFTMQQLNTSLSKTWKLGGLIDEAICEPNSKNPEVQLVHLGKEITAATCYGWDSPEFHACVEKIEGLTAKSAIFISRKLKNNTEESVFIARQFGAVKASEYIQIMHTRIQEKLRREQLAKAAEERQQKQQHVHQQLALLMQNSFTINQLFEKVLEGIHEGVGMDRTFFGLLSSDKKLLNERMILGWNKENPNAKLQLHVTSDPANLFFVALQQSEQEGLWVKPGPRNTLYSLHVVNVIGKAECFLVPVSIDNKPIGLIYTDRFYSGEALTEQDFSAVKEFVKQGIKGLAQLRDNKAV